jgi:hypothetical protein
MIHTIYEDDITPRWEQDMEVKDSVRTKMYEVLYDRPYKFASPKTKNATDTYGLPPGEDLDSIPDLPDVPVESRVTKPYIPPTDPGDLMSILDPPVN